MMENKSVSSPCECCGEPGTVSQAPWPLPCSTCHCNDCYALENIAYSVWREMTPITVHKFQAPIPFLKGKRDYPPEHLAGKENAAALREWFRQKMEKQA